MPTSYQSSENNIPLTLPDNIAGSNTESNENTLLLISVILKILGDKILIPLNV